MAISHKPSVPDEQQVAHVRRLLAVHRGIAERKMFGCPAFFLDRAMIACVFNDEIGLRLPPQRVDDLLGTGAIAPFRPYGKSMREWIALRARGAQLDVSAHLFLEAVAYATQRLA